MSSPPAPTTWHDLRWYRRNGPTVIARGIGEDAIAAPGAHFDP
jgi:hypothetical protein